MNPISNFFEKFKKLIQNSGLQKQAVIEAIKTITNIEVESKKIRFGENSIYINIPPAIKFQIFLKKEKILNEIKKSTGKQSFRDIK